MRATSSTSLSGPVNGSFAYDGFGRRRAKTIGGTTTQFLYDGLNPCRNCRRDPTANLLTGIGTDETYTRTDAAGTRAYLTDLLRSSVALADGSATIQTEYTYQPFGETSRNGAATDNSLAYTGREDDGTGLYYLRARYYHPATQRFLIEDPLRYVAESANLYSYVGNSPAQWNDPTGLAFLPMGFGTPCNRQSGKSPSLWQQIICSAAVMPLPTPAVAGPASAAAAEAAAAAAAAARAAAAAASAAARAAAAAVAEAAARAAQAALEVARRAAQAAAAAAANGGLDFGRGFVDGFGQYSSQPIPPPYNRANSRGQSVGQWIGGIAGFFQ